MVRYDDSSEAADGSEEQGSTGPGPLDPEKTFQVAVRTRPVSVSERQWGAERAQHGGLRCAHRRATTTMRHLDAGGRDTVVRTQDDMVIECGPYAFCACRSSRWGRGVSVFVFFKSV